MSKGTKIEGPASVVGRVESVKAGVVGGEASLSDLNGKEVRAYFEHSFGILPLVENFGQLVVLTGPGKYAASGRVVEIHPLEIRTYAAQTPSVPPSGPETPVDRTQD